MKIMVNKMVGDGEQFSIEVDLKEGVGKHGGVNLTGEELYARIKPALDLVDARLFELNMRIIEHNRMLKELPPEAGLGIRQAMEVLYGRRMPGVAEEAAERDRQLQRKAADEAGDPELAAHLERALEATDGGAL